ncbi:MAG: prolipoprotein diacylglyceryl transferase family protein [Thermodesulfobacteriota bacterium]
MFPFIEILGLKLSTWRIMALGGVLVCWALILIRTRRLGYSPYAIFSLVLLALPVGTAGGHLFNFLIPYVTGADNAEAMELLGLTVTGSIISTVAFGFLYLKYALKIPPLPVMDAIAFSLPLAIFFGRIGCIANGCCFGRLAPAWVESSFLKYLAVPVDLFIPPSVAWFAFQNAPEHSHAWNVPLLLMANALVTLFTAEYLFRNKERFSLPDGAVFFASFVTYSFGRFFAEFLREENTIQGSFFNPWQAVLFMFFAASVIILFVVFRNRKKGGMS